MNDFFADKKELLILGKDIGNVYNLTDELNDYYFDFSNKKYYLFGKYHFDKCYTTIIQLTEENLQWIKDRVLDFEWGDGTIVEVLKETEFNYISVGKIADEDISVWRVITKIVISDINDIEVDYYKGIS